MCIDAGLLVQLPPGGLRRDAVRVLLRLRRTPTRWRRPREAPRQRLAPGVMPGRKLCPWHAHAGRETDISEDSFE
jgi:hypothetical protein